MPAGKGSEGQLGAGRIVAASETPVEVSGGHSFASISAGGQHTCAVEALPSGKAYCWGVSHRPAVGQVGCCRLVRTAAIVMDVIQACDPSFHVTQAGTSGQLGNSLNSNQVSPVPVSGGHAFSAISAGGTHTCAIKLDSTTYCFGSSPANGLSLGTNVPRQIPGGKVFVALSAGTVTTCGLDSAGSVWCFGT